MVSLKALTLCLSIAIEHEARGTSFRTKNLVASVVMERAKGDKAKICKVVYEPHAFSYLKEHKPHNTIELKSFKESRTISEHILTGELKPIKGFKYFNTKELGILYHTKIKPISSGGMIFY